MIDNPTKRTKDYKSYSTFFDWGNYLPETGWRTLTQDEWQYLISYHKMPFATVCGIPGAILLPIGWETPKGITLAQESRFYSANQFNALNWEKLEKAGAIFLPAAGYYGYGDTMNDNCGAYWLPSESSHESTDKNAGELLVIQEYSGDLIGYSILKYCLCSVRLFKDITE